MDTSNGLVNISTKMITWMNRQRLSYNYLITFILFILFLAIYKWCGPVPNRNICKINIKNRNGKKKLYITSTEKRIHYFIFKRRMDFTLCQKSSLAIIFSKATSPIEAIVIVFFFLKPDKIGRFWSLVVAILVVVFLNFLLLDKET